eukprot:TRINITY_DN6419_c0_g1_i1.p1 TRINITY_DN6419_c0_g1~~TRINITY_DN6419_c0_g1_i1.p1  ORF type:complete len:118 (-),score=27.28 TRINITY_DN6419_c0_g1_i1:236-547(-)
MEVEDFRLMASLVDVLEVVGDGDSAVTSKSTEVFITKLKRCLETLRKLRGTNYTQSEKQALYESLLQRYTRQCAQLEEYRKLPVLSQFALGSEEKAVDGVKHE